MMSVSLLATAKAAASFKPIFAGLIIMGFVMVLAGLVREQLKIKSSNAKLGGMSKELLRATRGDRQQAERLLANAQLRYPGKSERWYVEKIIYDQERDGAGSGRGRR